jgi:hypothetical protein
MRLRAVAVHERAGPELAVHHDAALDGQPSSLRQAIIALKPIALNTRSACQP